MTMDYWFTIADDNAVDDEIQQHHGKIRVINIEHEPYDVIINALGYSFHLIFGSQINGKFLCIPDWNMGFELGPYDETLWNLTSLLSADKMSYEHATAIVNALSLLKRFLK